jgi:hypothetical protein
MPPRLEEELDAVSLHNMAIMNIEDDPTGGFEKMTFLLSQIPCPPETFGSLALLYIKYDYFDLAADLVAENADLIHDYIDTVSHGHVVLSCLTLHASICTSLSPPPCSSKRRLRKPIRNWMIWVARMWKC